MNNPNEKVEQWLESDSLAVIPDELYSEFRHIFEMMKEIQQNLHKVAEEMKPVDS
jgi:hypothetical protein